MRKAFTIFLCLFLASISYTQETINGSLIHDGLERNYILYVPANYTGDAPVPLVFNFHGYTSNAMEQMWYGDFRAIADSKGFLVVHPQGELLDGLTHWNVGGWTTESTIDDVGFTEALLDDLVSSYNIDQEKVYATGMSNGGYMSFLLACQLSNRFAAVASVTGSMTPQTYNACNPTHPTPVMQIHGTNDNVVPYSGDILWTHSIGSVVNYWVSNNACTIEEIVVEFPDINPGDNSTASHFVYSSCDNGANVEHIRINGGGHTWPGSAFNSPGTNYDFNASEMIWDFFSRYDINGTIVSSNTNEPEPTPSLEVFPNPARSTLFTANHRTEINEYVIYNSLGGAEQSGVLSPGGGIDVRQLEPGIYFLEVNQTLVKFLKVE